MALRHAAPRSANRKGIDTIISGLVGGVHLEKVAGVVAVVLSLARTSLSKKFQKNKVRFPVKCGPIAI